MTDVWNHTDPLSETLQGLRMNRSAFYLTEFCAPWILEMPAGCTNFYLVLEGDMCIQVTGKSLDAFHQLSRGDFALLLHDTPYRLSSLNSRGARPRTPAQMQEERISDRYRILRQGQGAALTRIFCGALRFDSPLVYELIRHWPEALVIKKDAVSETQHRQNLALTEMITTEASGLQPGWEAVCNRIADTLILQALRSWLKQKPDSGWLRALQDPGLSRAVALMHQKPSRAWRLIELATEARLSRSVFAARFRELLGETPMQYLTRARMITALKQLKETDLSLSELSHALGYSSEAAFHRAFKRVHGVTPGSVRRQEEARRQMLQTNNY